MALSCTSRDSGWILGKNSPQKEQLGIEQPAQRSGGVKKWRRSRKGLMWRSDMF